MATASVTSRGPAVVSGVAGKTLKFSAVWKNPDGSVHDSSGYTAKLQIRDSKHSRRVVLDVEESASPGAVLSRYTQMPENEERFLIILGKSYTTWLPESCILECELTNDINPEDVVPLFSVMIKLLSEQVM